MKNLIIDKILLFILLSVSVLFGANEKLIIDKSASPQYIEGNRTIYYTLTIRNTSSNSDYNTVTINDNIANGFFTDSDINITNISNSSFSCDINTSDTDSEITCVGDMNRTQILFIEYTAIAPDTPGQITNQASVNYNGSEIDTASVTVTIFPSYDNTLDYNRDVCYLPSASQGDDCKQSGAFFYGTDCNTSTQIIRNPDGDTADETLLNLHIYKSYTSPITNDDCYVEETNVGCTTNTLIDLLELPSSVYLETAFSEALDFSLGNLAPDTNLTIVDINTMPVSGQGANVVTNFEYIALIGRYNTSDSTVVEEYIYPCNSAYGIPPVIAPLTSAGINDVDLNNVDITQTDAADYIDYASYDKVGTKIVKQPFILGVTYLNAEGNPDTYDGEFDEGKILNAPVILTYEASNGLSDIPLWSGELKHGESHILTIEMEGLNDNGGTQNPYPIINEAFRNGKIKLELIDYGSFFRAVDGIQCAQSSLESSLCLLPACLNANEKILQAFPIENYPHVATCLYGDGGGASPCDSNAYQGKCGGKLVTISPPKYNNDYGCAMCIADATSEPSYSNIFSTRPKDFSLKVSEWENGLNKAGIGYGIDLNATTGTSNFNDINEINNNSTSDYYNTTFEGYHPPEVIAVIGLEDNASLSCPYDSNESQTIAFVDGHSASEVKYSNVGKVKLVIMDQNWTSVNQNNSTCIMDSNETNPVLDPLNHGRVGCKLITEKSMIFVPHHFNIDANLTDHNSINNFTYLHDFNQTTGVPAMGASLNLNVTAANLLGDATTNYIDGCYAKDNNITLDFNPFTITPTDNITHFLYYNPIDNTRSTIELPSPQTNINLPEPLKNTNAIFEVKSAPEINGTAQIEYTLNFNRTINKIVNPVKIELIDINMTDEDNVEDTITNITDQNITFYYARTRASKFFYEDISEPTVFTPIIVDIYCDLGFSSCDSLGINTVDGQINEINWWLSLGHQKTNNDGNITLVEGNVIEGASIGWSVSQYVNINANAIDPNIIVNRGPNPTLPLTVEIDIDEDPTLTDKWMIYNEDTDGNLEAFPSPLYKVRFIGTSGWAGHGKTGHVVDRNVSIKKHRRLGW